MLFASISASAWRIIIIIIGGGGGGGGGGGVVTRSLAADAVNDVIVVGHYAFLANGERGLHSVNLQDPVVPVRFPPLVIGGYSRSIAILGNYVYVATEGAGVHVVDVTIEENPVIVTTLIPTFLHVVQQANLVVVSTNYVCIGTDTGEIILFGGPGMTNQVGEIAVGTGTVLSIVLRGPYAFVTVQDGGLQILDLSNPAMPTLVGRWPSSGGTFPGLALAEDHAYLTAPGGLRVLSVTNLTTPVSVGFTNVPGQLTGVTVAGDYAYVAAGSSGLQILSITNRTTPVLVASMDTPGFALAVALFSRQGTNYAVVADDLGGTTIFDVSDPAHPRLISDVDPGSPPANDNFANRFVVLSGSCPITVTSSNRYATKETGEPDHAGQSGGRSVWWRWTAPFSGPVKVSTSESSFNTLLGIYTGVAVSNLSLVASNDNASGSDSFSAVQFNATAGTEYQIALDGFGKDHGQIQIQILPLAGSSSLPQ